MKDFQRKLSEIQRKLPAAIKRLPGIAKIEGLRFIAENFKRQGFEEKPGKVKKWKKKKNGHKPTLIGEKRGGAMRRGWQGKSNDTHAELSNQLPYTEVHNDGLMAGRPPGFKMPQREMIGPSEALDKNIEDKFDRVVDDTFS